MYPLDQAKYNWKIALQKKKARQYDQATIHFLKSLEMLFKANCPNHIPPTQKNLLNLSEKTFAEIPEEIRNAIIFLNPHYTLVKSVYTADFVDEIHEKSKLVAEWVFSQTSKYNRFDLDPQ
jgi:hypothetical protein